MKKGMDAAMIAASWSGEPASALISSWGMPTADMPSAEFAKHAEYSQDILQESASSAKDVPSTTRVLVYQTTVGQTFRNVKGTMKFTIETPRTTLYVGVDTAGTVTGFTTHTDTNIHKSFHVGGSSGVRFRGSSSSSSNSNSSNRFHFRKR